MLVTVETYRRITGDSTTAENDVESALADAQSLIEESLDRVGILESAEHTETAVVVRGRVYPLATPVTEADYTIRDNGRVLVDVDEFTNGLVVAGDTYEYLPRIEITYTGGYTSATLPLTLAQAICQTAHRQLHPTTAVDSSIIGAKSVRIGDASITYSDAGAGAVVSALTSSVARSIRKYRRQSP